MDKATVTIGLCLLLLATPYPGIAQNPEVFNYSVSEGMPSSQVYEVFQDKAGFLWFATDNGVARYDGREFEAFDVSDGVTDPVVFSFQQDDDNNIWFRTFSGRLCYFDGENIHPYKYNNALLSNGDYAIFNFQYDGASDRLWFTMAHLFGSISADGKVETQAFARGTLFVKSINGKLLEGNDLKYSTRNIIIGDRRFPVSLSDTAQHKFYNTITQGDKIYVSIYKDLFLYTTDQLTKTLSSKEPIISLSTDLEGNLWVGYLNHGVERFSEGGDRWTPDFLKEKSVTKVLEDAAGGFWFTTLESGAYYVPNFQIQNHPLPVDSRIKTVEALTDTVLIGSQSGDLVFVNHDAATLSKKKYPGEVYAIFRDHSNKIWVSAGMDIFRYMPGFRRPKRYRRLIATSFEDGPQGTVWAYGGIRMTSFDNRGRLTYSRARHAMYRSMLIRTPLSTWRAAQD